MDVLVLVLPLVLFAAVFGGVVQNASDCGVQKITPDLIRRIISGNETSYGKYPWMAALHYKHKTTGLDAGIYCGGFVINDKFVVTAANCLYPKLLKLNQVWLGVRTISEVDTIDVDIVRKYDVEKVIPHENYNALISANDIALLKVNRLIIYSDFIRPLCLPEADSALPEGGTMLTAAGWGNIDQEGSAADLKLAIDLPMYTHEFCQENLGRQIRSDQMCAEGEYLKGTCWGDEGGPLMYPLPSGINRKWYAIGIISSGLGCGKHGTAIVHTRVSSYVNWIKNNVVKS